MKMKLYYVVEESGFEESELYCTYLKGPFHSRYSAEDACRPFEFVVEQTIEVQE